MTNNPSSFTGSSNRPVERVIWDEAVLYCQRLNTREQADGRLPAGWSYRLPTEAEWEYAARAGTTTSYYFGDDGAANREPFFAWYNFNAGGTTHDVGGRAPNRWGLYDIYGNVREWCSDWYSWLPEGNETDPQGPPSSNSGFFFDPRRVARGGSYNEVKEYCKSSRFYPNPNIPLEGPNPSTRDARVGFRVVLAQNP